MKIKLLNYTSLVHCANAIRTCYDTRHKGDGGGDADKELINRVGNKYKHSSVLEHIVYTFDIIGISRACLQELARHRMASLTVKSTRYTLKELRKEESFIDNPETATKYIVLTSHDQVNMYSIIALDNLRLALKEGISNDLAKYCLPECYKTNLTWTINLRSLQNFIKLRTDKRALWEIQNLASGIIDVLPEDHRILVVSNL